MQEFFQGSTNTVRPGPAAAVVVVIRFRFGEGIGVYPVLVGPEAVGLRLARTVFKPGTTCVWVRAGVELTPPLIRSFLTRGISTVYVHNPLAQMEVPEVIPEVTRQGAVLVLQKSANHLRGGGDHVVAIMNLVGEMIRSLPQDGDHLWNMASLRTRDHYTFEHSVNTAVIAMMVGRRLHYSERELRGLGLGAMLHDLGKVFIPLEILHKPGKLDPREWEIMQGHSRKGYEVLSRQWEISLVSSHCALQHHERLDGSGYPRGLRGTEIHEWTHITAIADVFDALTAERAYKRAVSPREALAYLREHPEQFDPRLVATLTSMASPFQTGSWVVLTNGWIGVVAAQQPDTPDRPEVAVVAKEADVPVPLTRIRLSQTDLRIAEVLPTAPVTLQHQEPFR